MDDGDVIDSMFMSKKALCEFFEEQMEDARKTGVMFSLHVKATMLKVSHPIVFGHAVKVFYKDAFAKHQDLFDELGVNVNNGLVDLYWSIPGFMHTSFRVTGVLSGVESSVVLGLGFCGWASAKAVHKPAFVVPAHPRGGQGVDRLAAKRGTLADTLGLIQPSAARPPPGPAVPHDRLRPSP